VTRPPSRFEPIRKVWLITVCPHLQEEFDRRNIRHPRREMQQGRSAVPKHHGLLNTRRIVGEELLDKGYISAASVASTGILPCERLHASTAPTRANPTFP